MSLFREPNDGMCKQVVSGITLPKGIPPKLNPGEVIEMARKNGHRDACITLVAIEGGLGRRPSRHLQISS